MLRPCFPFILMSLCCVSSPALAEAPAAAAGNLQPQSISTMDLTTADGWLWGLAGWLRNCGLNWSLGEFRTPQCDSCGDSRKRLEIMYVSSEQPVPRVEQLKMGTMSTERMPGIG